MEKKEAFRRAASLCASSEKCIFDIKLKLKSWELDANSVSWVVEQLITENFINEERYAKAYAMDQFRFQGWGRNKINFALKAKNIDEQNIRTALAGISSEEYHESLKMLLARKKNTIHETDSYKFKSKLFKFALSRGFESSEINRALTEIIDAD